MTTERKTPFYEQLSFTLLLLLLMGVIVVYSKSILLPFLFSILLANTLLPATHFLVRKKFNKPLSILVPLFLALLLGAGMLYFLSSQIVNFMDDAPTLERRWDETVNSLQKWFGRNIHVTVSKQNQMIDDKVKDFGDKAPELLRKTFVSLKEILTYVVLVPVYSFLILYYRVTIKVFITSLFRNSSKKNVSEVLLESREVAQRYLIGLSLETLMVFTLNTIGFLIVGVKYAVFLALLAALLNLIPYLGMLVANVLCMVITLVSSNEISNVIWVGVILAVVQFIDNNFGMPLIVGNTVRINALVTILGVLIGGMFCGVPGMFLAIPGLAVLKIICDKVPELKPWGILLGEDLHGNSRTKVPSPKNSS